MNTNSLIPEFFVGDYVLVIGQEQARENVKTITLCVGGSVVLTGDPKVYKVSELARCTQNGEVTKRHACT
jgi:hypothetical protein